MDIHNGFLFWPTTYNRPTHENPPIAPCYDVVIVGGGMSGVLTAHALLEEGLKVALLDKRQPGEGSTAANTGLLQFSNDIMLHELIEQIGEQQAVRFYQLCFNALDDLEKIANTLDGQADFIRRPSLYYASKPKDAKKIAQEYEVLKKFGFPCTYLDEQQLQETYGIEKKAALLTTQDAEINPYKFVVQLVERLKQKGLDVFEKTMLNIVEEENDLFTLHTIAGIFHTKRLVFTTGYERLPVGKMKGADVNRSYVAVTKPINNLQPWHENALIWETARPYFYARTTVDQRIIIGGLDERKSKAPKKLEKIEKQADELAKVLTDLFPHLSVEIEYLYGASFGESLDHLPFIGVNPQNPLQFYLLGYGGNGTVYSMLGSKILADLIMDRPNEDAALVTLNRKYGLK